MNEIVVELYGFARKFGYCRLHWLTPAEIIPPRSPTAKDMKLNGDL